MTTLQFGAAAVQTSGAKSFLIFELKSLPFWDWGMLSPTFNVGFLHATPLVICVSKLELEATGFAGSTLARAMSLP